MEKGDFHIDPFYVSEQGFDLYHMPLRLML